MESFVWMVFDEPRLSTKLRNMYRFSAWTANVTQYSLRHPIWMNGEWSGIFTGVPPLQVQVSGVAHAHNHTQSCQTAWTSSWQKQCSGIGETFSSALQGCNLDDDASPNTITIHQPRWVKSLWSKISAFRWGDLRMQAGGVDEQQSIRRIKEQQLWQLIFQGWSCWHGKCESCGTKGIGGSRFCITCSMLSACAPRFTR